MPSKPKTPEEIEIEKKKIMKVALNIIAEQGYNNMTMRSIASGCGSSATKIYYYFANKEEIYFNIIKIGFELLHQEIRYAYCEGNDPIGRFKKVSRAFFHFASENVNYYDLMFSTRTPRRMDYDEGEIAEVAELEKEMAMMVYQFWTKCVSELAIHLGGQLDDYDSIALFSQIHGVINLHHANNMSEINIDFDTLSEKVVDKMLDNFRLGLVGIN
ncbi:TetR/AcrR family transcriptional regulator [Eubacteriaceae bacterium ES3]|nr:TetR/AcrR family transcriptional regulator [Eubacteriaceae bacterium ES3]